MNLKRLCQSFQFGQLNNHSRICKLTHYRNNRKLDLEGHPQASLHEDFTVAGRKVFTVKR